MGRHDYDYADEASEDAAQDTRPRSREKRHHGDRLTIVFFVIGLAACIIGLSSRSLYIGLVGVALLAIGIIALLRPTLGASAQAWRCPSCGWVFEMSVKHPRARISGVCPHCHEPVRLEAIRRK